MKTKILAATIVFAALTVALNPAISGIGIPAPYAPYLIYGLWEIPIVAAFLLISATSGVAISLVNATVLFALFPGSLPAGPFYNLIAIFSMLLGLYLARRFTKPESKQQQNCRGIHNSRSHPARSHNDSGELHYTSATVPYRFRIR
jgi:riboflavin transporter FmnP